MFKTKDPQGREISLSKETWHQHISVNHPELKGSLPIIQSAVENPNIIATSSTRPSDSIVYLSTHSGRTNLVIKVAVCLGTDTQGDVSTAMLQKDMLQGAQIPGGILYAKK